MILIKFNKISIIRKSETTYNDDGIAVQGEESSFDIEAHVYPIKENELQFFPEGSRIDSIYKIKSKILLKTDEKNQSADIALINGKKYQIISIGDWTAHQNPLMIGTFYKYAAQLLENQA